MKNILLLTLLSYSTATTVLCVRFYKKSDRADSCLLETKKACDRKLFYMADIQDSTSGLLIESIKNRPTENKPKKAVCTENIIIIHQNPPERLEKGNFRMLIHPQKNPDPPDSIEIDPSIKNLLIWRSSLNCSNITKLH